MYNVIATVQPSSRWTAYSLYPVTDTTLRTGRSTVLAQWSDRSAAFRHVERLLASVQPVGVLYTYTVREA